MKKYLIGDPHFLPSVAWFLIHLVILLLGGQISEVEQHRLEHYIAEVVLRPDCDYLNDFLTHLEPETAAAAQEIGQGYCEGSIIVHQIHLPFVARGN